MSSIDETVDPRTVIAAVIEAAEEVANVEAAVDLKEAGLSQRDALLTITHQ